MTQKKTKTTRKKSTTTTQATNRRRYEMVFESDSTYLLKLVSFVLLGTLWLKFQQPLVWLGFPISGLPIGLLIGLLLVHRFESNLVDRKIWFAILIVVTIICYFVPAGIVI